MARTIRLLLLSCCLLTSLILFVSSASVGPDTKAECATNCEPTFTSAVDSINRTSNVEISSTITPSLPTRIATTATVTTSTNTGSESEIEISTELIEYERNSYQIGRTTQSSTNFTSNPDSNKIEPLINSIDVTQEPRHASVISMATATSPSHINDEPQPMSATSLVPVASSEISSTPVTEIVRPERTTGVSFESNNGNLEESRVSHGNRNINTGKEEEDEEGGPNGLISGNDSDEESESKFNLLSRLSKSKQLKSASPEDSNVFEELLRKRPYSEFLSVEQKWDDVFKRFARLQQTLSQRMSRSIFKQIEQADLGVTSRCLEDLVWLRTYVRSSSNIRFLAHMLDSFGKIEAASLSGNAAHLGHVIQCIKTRAPNVVGSNDTFDERYFESQTDALGERFRGRYCLASVRPVLPPRPSLVSSHSRVLDVEAIGNVSRMLISLNKTTTSDNEAFESEAYQWALDMHQLAYELTRMIGVCYPSSCSREDVRASLQETFNDLHQVVDIEFECEIDTNDVPASLQKIKDPKVSRSSDNTTRVVALVALVLHVLIVSVATLLNAFGVLGRPSGRLKWHEGVSSDGKESAAKKLSGGGGAAGLADMTNALSLPKCASLLFIKMAPESTCVSERRDQRNTRSTTIDMLRAMLVLAFIYSQIVHLGFLGPQLMFMWSKWSDAMVPFYRSLVTQLPVGVFVWSDAFYFVAGYMTLVSLDASQTSSLERRFNFVQFVAHRYFRLLLPVLGMIALNYVWPTLSNGFVFTDQAHRLQYACNERAWTQLLMANNYGHYFMSPSYQDMPGTPTNHTGDMCLWPSHVASSMMQLHLLAYLLMLLVCRRNYRLVYTLSAVLIIVLGCVWPAYDAYRFALVAPFQFDYPDRYNYQRVINRLVIPTHNHLCAYLLGFLLAVRRYERDTLVTQFDGATTTTATNKQPAIQWTRACAALLATVTPCLVSFYWAGLSEPITRMQTFWYHALVKLAFSLAFTWLFVELRLGDRRNSHDPWMITRLLVPIGRMSYSVYLISWLVVWFDLLASLYQWYPSHYFVFEKYNEIVFITVALSLFAYAIFEAPLITLRRLLVPVIHTDSDTSNEKDKTGLVFATKASTGPLVGPKRLSYAPDVVTKQQQQQQHSTIPIIIDTTSDAEFAQNQQVRRQSQVADAQRLAELRANTSFASLAYSMQSINDMPAINSESSTTSSPTEATRTGFNLSPS